MACQHHKKITLKVSEPKLYDNPSKSWQEISLETTNVSITVALMGEEKTVSAGRKSLGNQRENKRFMSIYLIVVEIFQTAPQ